MAGTHYHLTRLQHLIAPTQEENMFGAGCQVRDLRADTCKLRVRMERQSKQASWRDAPVLLFSQIIIDVTCCRAWKHDAVRCPTESRFRIRGLDGERLNGTLRGFPTSSQTKKLVGFEGHIMNLKQIHTCKNWHVFRIQGVNADPTNGSQHPDS